MLKGRGNFLAYLNTSTLVFVLRGAFHRLSRSLMSVFFLLLLLGCESALAACPLSFIDSSGSEIFLDKKPQKVVSLAPAITGIIFRLGAGDCLAGLTLHDTQPPGSGNEKIPGGFLAPSSPRIASIQPDVLFVSSINREIWRGLPERGCLTVELESRSISDLYRNIQLLGSVFDKDAVAEEVIKGIRNDLALISRKVEKIPLNKRKRVLRVMGIGKNSLMVPGDDSFQNELIRSAGGTPPLFGKKGEAVYVSPEEWGLSDPEVVYVCGKDRKSIDTFLSQPEWKGVRATREGKVFSFPCNLTCRISVKTGDFVAWLASTIYDREFAAEQNRVLEEKLVRTHPIELPLPYVRSARVDETTIFDFPNKTLIIEFREPMRVTSTLEGERKAVASVGNHYFPPPCWSLEYKQGFKKWKEHTLRVIGKSEKNTCLLFTGADMGNLSVQKAQFKNMTVYALVTAGVEGNAMRMSVDEGLFYEPGTINILLLTNMKLTPRAMARAIITATEAKTAAMQDLDIRSSVSPARIQATGTGTDEVLVVEGRGARLDEAGGHCKLGELIARAVHEGVKEAVYRQNTITAQRSVFQRLKERHIAVYEILREHVCMGEDACAGEYLTRFEEILLEPRYAAFLESAFSLSDANERRILTNLEVLQPWCRSMAEEIAEKKLNSWEEYVNTEDMPVVLKMFLNALLNGLVRKDRQSANGESDSHSG
jgi:iron complex transport system substrate-binding protein